MTFPLSALLAAALAAGSPGDDPAAMLRDGIALVEAGDLDQAVERLEQAIERLGPDPAREGDRSRAHLYLAMAQLGRGQAERARVHMRAAWAGRKGAKLDPQTFPPRVIALYEEVGKELRPRGASTKLVAGVGAAAAGAGALVGASLAGGPPPRAAEAPRPASSVRVFNSDDIGRVSLNGQLLFEVGLAADSGAVDITSRLRSGANEIVFELFNAHGAISYGFEVREGSAIVFQQTCGIVFRSGCEDDRKFPSGVIRHYTYTIQGPAQ
jgi:hypothetical protein